jgi:hypothetical protein
MTLSRHMRFYSADEIRLIAARIDQLVKRDHIVRLRPETAWLVEQAVRAYAARPNRSEIMKLFCTVSNCNPATCMNCMGKANAVMQLCQPWRE